MFVNGTWFRIFGTC